MCTVLYIYILYFLLYYYICLFHFFAAFFGQQRPVCPPPNLAMGISAIQLNRSFYWQNGLIISRCSRLCSRFFSVLSLSVFLLTLSWPYCGYCFGSFVAADDDDDEPLCASGNNTLFSICATVETPSSPSSPPLPSPSSCHSLA